MDMEMMQAKKRNLLDDLDLPSKKLMLETEDSNI
jgi:hypothetical protein